MQLPGKITFQTFLMTVVFSKFYIYYVIYVNTIDRNVSQEMVAVGLYDIRSKAISFNTANPISWPGKTFYSIYNLTLSVTDINKAITDSNLLF